jgi:hypothetical protein
MKNRPALRFGGGLARGGVAGQPQFVSSGDEKGKNVMKCFQTNDSDHNNSWPDSWLSRLPEQGEIDE